MTDAVANRTLSTLVSHGILTETTGQRRNRVWQQGTFSQSWTATRRASAAPADATDQSPE